MKFFDITSYSDRRYFVIADNLDEAIKLIAEDEDDNNPIIIKREEYELPTSNGIIFSEDIGHW